MKLDVFLEALPPKLALDYGVQAEERGIRAAWFPEITFGDAFGPATAVATRTSRLELATGVVGIWSRSPVTMALQAATLNELAGGRLILGLGLQARGYVEGWHGQRYERPVRAMREYLTILRQILGGESVTFEGEIFSVRGFQLTMQPPERPPRIYMAAIGPQMLRLAGELADGVLGYCYTLEYLRDGADVYRTYFTDGRGVETLGTTWSFLDVTPLGRQEDWEDSPEGYPQTPRYTWWRRHDEYAD